MSKEKLAPKPEPVSGKGVVGAHLGRRYDAETHQWVEDAAAPSAVQQSAPVGEKE